MDYPRNKKNKKIRVSIEKSYNSDPISIPLNGIQSTRTQKC
jgi:hypothetical protein